MIPLNQIEVAAPCHESWSEMDGNGAVRFCARCSRNVYNLSEMTVAQAQTLVAETEGRLCVRFYQRGDGTMITRDCPVGVRIARRRFVTALSWAATLVIASITGTTRPAVAADTASHASAPVIFTTMGDMDTNPPSTARTTPSVTPVAVKKTPLSGLKWRRHSTPSAVQQKPHSTRTMGKIAAPTPKVSPDAQMGRVSVASPKHK